MASMIDVSERVGLNINIFKRELVSVPSLLLHYFTRGCLLQLLTTR